MDNEDRLWPRELPRCVYNDSVDCGRGGTQTCASCGWNPDVAWERKRATRWRIRMSLITAAIWKGLDGENEEEAK